MSIKDSGGFNVMRRPDLSIDLGCFASFIDACRAAGRHPDEDECSTPRMAASGKQARDERQLHDRLRKLGR